MTPRLNAFELAPEIAKQGTRLQEAVNATGVDPLVMELIKLRASQINGCAYCLNMHSREARKRGETEQRLYVLAAWRESTLYTPAERAALAWTEALTHVDTKGAPDAAFEELKKHFTDVQIVGITAQASMIALWNRLAIGLGFVHPSETDHAAAAQTGPT
jgi:AhpD family alkylhydroperoxidase